MTQNELFAGVDIGGTNTIYGFVTRDGDIIGQGGFATAANDPPAALVDHLVTAIERDFRPLRDNGAVLKGIGIGAPNANYYTGQIAHPPNFNWNVVPLVDMITAHVEVPVVMTNDANAAAIGEMTFGKARDVKDFILITLGTGLGSGIVSNGQLLLGASGFAGEMGHMLAHPGSDRQCGCGKKGCLETYASATGIVTTARQLLASSDQASTLRDLAENALDSRSVGMAAAAGDDLARRILSYTGTVLGTQLANAALILAPSAIYLFGGPANDGDLIIAPTRRAMEDNLITVMKNTITIEVSGLQNKNAAILGAASLMACR